MCRPDALVRLAAEILNFCPDGHLRVSSVEVEGGKTASFLLSYDVPTLDLKPALEKLIEPYRTRK